MIPTRFERGTINLAHFDKRNELIEPLKQYYNYSRYEKLIFGLIRETTNGSELPEVLVRLLMNIGSFCKYFEPTTTAGYVNCDYAFGLYHQYLSGIKTPPTDIPAFRASIFEHIIEYDAKPLLDLARKIELKIEQSQQTLNGYLFDRENDLIYLEKAFDFVTGTEMNDISAKIKIAPVQAYCTKNPSLDFIFVFFSF